MKQPTREPTADGGSAEALVLACVLSTAAFVLLLLWLASDNLRPIGPIGSRDVWVHRCFLPTGLLVLLLDGLAFVALGLRLIRPSRAPFARWVFGAGLLAMILAMVAAALVMWSHTGARAWQLYVRGFSPEVANAVFLLACGGAGLLAATLVVLLERARPHVPPGDRAGLFLLGVAALLLAALPTAWFAFLSRISGNVSTSYFASAPLWFAGFASAGGAVIILSLLVPPGASGKLHRLSSRVPIETVALLGLVGLALWSLVVPLDSYPSFRGGFFSGESVREFGHISGPLAVVHGLALAALAVCEGVHWRRRQRCRSPDHRIAVMMVWIGSVAVGLSLVSVATGLTSVADEVLRWRLNAMPGDFSACIQSGAVLTLFVPIFLIAHLLVAARPFVAGRSYRLLRGLGLAVVVSSVLGLMILTSHWWRALSSGGDKYDSFEWLRLGAQLLLWGALTFLTCATVAGVREFVRQGHQQTVGALDPEGDAELR